MCSNCLNWWRNCLIAIINHTIPVKKNRSGFIAEHRPIIKTVVLLGFEPRQADPETAVLPLHHKTESCF